MVVCFVVNLQGTIVAPKGFSCPGLAGSAWPSPSAVVSSEVSPRCRRRSSSHCKAKQALDTSAGQTGTRQ